MAATALPAIFDALSDPTRLAIVEKLLIEGELPAGALAAPFAVSKPAISRHLRILEGAELIEHRVDRQWRRYRIKTGSIEAIDQWLSHYRAFWGGTLDRLEQMLLEDAGRKDGAGA